MRLRFKTNNMVNLYEKIFDVGTFADNVSLL